MSNDLKSFLTSAKDMAEARGLIWNVRFESATGAIPRDDRWNLSQLAGIHVKPQISLASMSTYQPALALVEELSGDRPAPVMPDDWVELFKAVLVHDQFVKRNKPKQFRYKCLTRIPDPGFLCWRLSPPCNRPRPGASGL